MQTTSISCRMRYATIPGKPPSIVPSSYAPGCCWSWMRTPHPSLGALSGSWCPDVSSVFIARIGASATIERLHAKSIQKSDLPVIFLIPSGQTRGSGVASKSPLQWKSARRGLLNIASSFCYFQTFVMFFTWFFSTCLSLCQIFLSLLSSYPCGSFQEPSTAGCGSHRRWARPCHH